MLHVRLESRLGIPICFSVVFATVKAGEQSRWIKGLSTVGFMDLQALIFYLFFFFLKNLKY